MASWWWLLGLAAADPVGETPAPTPAEAAPVADPGAAELAPAVDPGAAEVARLTALLAAGRAKEALQGAILGVALYPSHAASLQALAEMSLLAIERQRGAGPAPAPAQAPAGGPAPAAAPTAVAQAPTPTAPVTASGGTIRRPLPEAKTRVGFDLGMPMGVRAERTLGDGKMRAVGARLGAGVFLYDAAGWYVPDTSIYLDIATGAEWQIEVSAGLGLYFLEAFPNVGVAAQFDPRGPFQLNLGMKVGRDGSVLPDISVGLLF
jgi:hypothetical protein